MRKHHVGRGIRLATKWKRPTGIVASIDADLKKERAIEQKNAWRSELKKRADVQSVKKTAGLLHEI